MVATTSHIFSGKVDIASNLQVGSSHLFVDTENNRVGINTVSPDASLHVVGNVYATSFEGDGSLLTGIASNLEQIANNGNVTSNTVQFTNPNTGIVTTGNVEVGNKLSVNSLTPGSVPYIDGENTLVDSYITQGVNTISITSNLEVTGNILVTGDSYKIDSQSLEVKDRIIGVAYENTLSGADTGILLEYPTKNIGLIHHGASGNPYAQEFTIGYTQNTSTDTTILHDTANNITVNVLGHLHTQNNMTVETGGSYYGDGTTLTGVALSVDMTSNALRITNVESVNGSQTGLITGLRTDVTTLTTANTVQASLITGIKTDMTSNASRITTLESANTVQGGLITAIETDVTDNASRITTLESANTVQGGLITAIETDVTDNASRITTLESANTVQGGLITVIETNLTDNASRITTLESANTVQGGLITAIETDVTDNASRITTLESANTVQAGLITAIDTDVTDNASRITTLESANTVQASLITAIETNLTDNASRVTSLEATDAVFSGLLSGLRTDLDDTFITKTTDTTVISSNLEVTGNIFMRGERFIIESETTLINDAIIGIANNNTTSTTDVGILMQRPNANVALVHHGGTDTFTIGYTQDTLEATDITNDTTNEINVNVLGQLHVQNNLTVGTGGSYYGDGTTLTGVALSTDMTSNASRITTLESANTVQGGLITAIETDVTDNASRITTLESANTVQGGLITAIETDVTDNASRITTLESANTVQGGLITAIETDVTDNASRITTLESANTVQGSLITAIETDVTDNALRITNLEASNVNIWSNLASNVLRIDELVASNTDIWSNLALVTLNDVVNVNNATSNTVLFTNTDTSLVASGNVMVSGNVTSITSIVSNATTMGTTKTFVVTVNGNYYIDGVERHLLELHQGQTYIFDMSDSTNSGHPLAFSTAFTGSSSSYTTGVVSNHDTVPSGTAGSKVTFSVPLNAPSSIYYYCTVHGAGMGSTGTASSISPTAELIVSGRVVASGNVEASAFKGDGTTLTGVALKVDLDSNVTRITNLETSNLTYTPLITGLRTDVDAHDTRLDLVEPRVSALEASNVDIWSNLELLTLNDVVNVNNATSNTVLFTNANTSLVASGNVTVSGNVTSTTSLISNAATLGTTKEFVVTHADGAFYIDGVQQDSLELHEHQTYLFDLTAPGSGHPFRLSTTSDGTHGGGSEYTTGTDYSSIANHLKFTVPSGAPSTLYYYCTIHSGMGGSISIASTSELIVSGRVVASGNVEASSFKGDGTELSGIALKTDLVSNVTRIASLETDMTANAARVDTLYTATTGDIIVATGTNTLGKLGIGGSGQVLKVASGGTTLEWAAESGGAAGAIVSNSSGITTGFTRGDLIYASADNTLNKLALGTANQVLKSDGTDVVWGTDGGGAGSTPWGTNGNKIFYNTDNVGIGTNAPAFKLDVHGTANVGALTATTLSVGGAAVALDADMTANAARVDALYTATTGDIIYATGTDALGKLNIGGTTGHVLKVSASGTPEWAAESGGGGGGSSQWTGTTEIYFDGNVGIANTNPGHDLSVGSNLFVDDSGSNVLVIDGNVAAESMTIGGISIVPSYPLSSVTDTGNVTPHTIEFTNATTGLVVSSNIVVAGNVTAAYLYGDASNVTGIASNLHQIVENGNVTSNTVQFTNATTGLVTTANVEVGGELTVSGNVTIDTDTLKIDSTNNRVGIGTTDPSNSLHMYKAASEATSGLFIEKASGGVGTAAALLFGTSAPSETNNVGIAKGGIFFERTTTNGRGDLQFCVDNVDNTTPIALSHSKMTIQSDGSVGIGTTSPDAKLHVKGDIIGRPISKTRTITKGTSGSGQVETFTLAEDENRILLNNHQGSAGSSRDYTTNFTAGVPTAIGTIIHLEMNSSRTNNSASGVNHKTRIQFNGVDVLSTGNNYLSSNGGANQDSYQRNLKRIIILTTDGWVDYSLYPKISMPVTDDAIVFSTTNNSQQTSTGSNNPLTEKMRIDGSGRIKYNAQPRFSAYSTDSNTTYVGFSAPVVLNKTFYNVGSCYSTSTGAFTAPVSGHYRFSFVTFLTGGNTQLSLWYRSSNSGNFDDVGPYKLLGGSAGGDETIFTSLLNTTGTCTFDVYVPANYQITFGGRGAPSITIYRSHSYFSGELISAA